MKGGRERRRDGGKEGEVDTEPREGRLLFRNKSLALQSWGFRLCPFRNGSEVNDTASQLPCMALCIMIHIFTSLSVKDFPICQSLDGLHTSAPAFRLLRFM